MPVGSVTINNKTYVIRCTFVDDESFDLCLTNGSHVFYCKDTLNNVKTHSLQIPEHNSLLKQALLSLDTKTFVYGLANLNNRLTLLIKFVVQSNVGEYTAAQIPLLESQDPNAANMALFMELIERNSELQAQNQMLEQKANQRDQFQKLAIECTSQKEELERQLYASFLEVVNGKKAKIRQLIRSTEGYKKEVEELKAQIKEQKDVEKELRATLKTSKMSANHLKASVPEYGTITETPVKRRNTQATETTAGDMLDFLMMEDDIDL